MKETDEIQNIILCLMNMAFCPILDRFLSCSISSNPEEGYS